MLGSDWGCGRMGHGDWWLDGHNDSVEWVYKLRESWKMWSSKPMLPMGLQRVHHYNQQGWRAAIPCGTTSLLRNGMAVRLGPSTSTLQQESPHQEPNLPAPCLGFPVSRNDGLVLFKPSLYGIMLQEPKLTKTHHDSSFKILKCSSVGMT